MRVLGVIVPDRGNRLSPMGWVTANDGRNVTHRLYHRPWFRAFVRRLRRWQR